VDGRDRLSLLSGAKKSPLEVPSRKQLAQTAGCAAPMGRARKSRSDEKKNAMEQLLTEKRCMSSKRIQPVASVNVWSA
jgi:hypothetical protein